MKHIINQWWIIFASPTATKTPWPHANCVPWDQLWHLHWWGTALKESIQNISGDITGYYRHISSATANFKVQDLQFSGPLVTWLALWIYPSCVYSRNLQFWSLPRYTHCWGVCQYRSIWSPLKSSQLLLNHPCRVYLTVFRGSSTIFTQSHFGAPLLPWRRGQVWPSRKRSFKLSNSLGLSLDPQHQAGSKRLGFNKLLRRRMCVCVTSK